MVTGSNAPSAPIVITGGAGAYIFVVDGGTGHDVIINFNATEGDRIQLRNGVTYTVGANAAGDAVITFSGSDDVVLSGIRRGNPAHFLARRSCLLE